jgi:putative phage-type endonuclease
MGGDLGDRKTYIGGSDIGAICGLSPFKTPLGVYLDKTGEVSPFEGNVRTEWGTLLEGVILKRYEEVTGNRVERVPELRHPERPWQVGHLDGACSDKRIVVEAKTAGFRQAHRWGAEGTDEVPAEYLLQCAWYLNLTGYDAAEIAVLFDGSDFRVYRIERDRDLEAGILKLAEAFWRNHVVPRRPPAIDGSEKAAEWLLKRFPQARGEYLPSTPEADAIAIELRDARMAKEAAEAREVVAKNRLMELIGDGYGFRGEWGSVRWSNCKGRASVDWEALLAETGLSVEQREALVAKHTKRNPYRQFTPTFKKEK